MHQIVVVIPTLNESAYIGTVLRDVMVRNSDIPVWVFDGGSSDHTRQIVKGYKRLFPLLELHDNPGKTQARATNCAAMLARSRGIKTLVRLDAHARYSPNFVQIVTDRLEQSGADSVVVPLVAEGKTLWQAAAADLQRSWLGNGGAAHRNGQAGGWVDPGEGKTTLSLMLAHNLSAMGKSVLIVEGDIRRRVFQNYFKMPKAGDLVSVIEGDIELQDAIWYHSGHGIDILPATKPSINAADIFSTRRFRRFVKAAGAAYDHVIIDTPPVLAVPDARLVGQSSDAILYAVRWDKTPKATVKRGLRSLELAGLAPTGLALAQINVKGLKQYGYSDDFNAEAYYDE